jgi:uncharacterized protein with von Willebrand factor type A (vWA) domain
MPSLSGSRLRSLRRNARSGATDELRHALRADSHALRDIDLTPEVKQQKHGFAFARRRVI